MNIFSLLSSFAVVIYLILGYQIFLKNPKSLTNRLFFYCCLALAIWSFSQAFLYMSPDIKYAEFWFKIVVFGWSFFPPLIFHFFFRLTQYHKVLKIKNWIFLIYLIPLAFIIPVFYGYPVYFIQLKTGMTWTYKPDQFQFWLMFSTFLFFLFSCVFLLYRWYKKTNLHREKIQAVYVLNTTILVLFLCFPYEILPTFFNIMLPTITHILMVIWVISIWHVTTRYKMMVLTPEIAANEIIANIQELLIITNTSGNILSINNYTEKSMGYKLEEVAGKPVFSFIHEEKQFIEKIQVQHPEGSNFKMIEYNFKTKEGGLLPVKFSCTTIQDKYGDILGKVLIGHDNTNEKRLKEEIRIRKKIEVELQEAKYKAERADNMKSSFLANMSHEIRTPLNGIIGFAELLEDKSYSDEEKKDFTQSIQNSGNHLLKIINDIIDISRIESGLIHISETECNLNSLMDELHSFFRSEKYTKEKPEVKLKLFTSIENDDCYIMADETRVRQILTNLIANAFKFTEKGYIEYGYRMKDSNLLFFVKDTGIGLTPDKKEIIFNRFMQADNSIIKKYGGTGLGLSISKGLVELMGGTIWVESDPGKESCFFFTLPLKPYIPDEDNEEPTPIEMPLPDWKGKTALIVEDNELNYKFIAASLEKTNIHILHAEGANEAMDLCLNRKEIDIILLDIFLPEPDGFDIIKKVRENNLSTPIIVQTANIMSGEKQKCIKLGCDEFLSKPINKKNLFLVMQKYLG